MRMQGLFKLHRLFCRFNLNDRISYVVPDKFLMRLTKIAPECLDDLFFKAECKSIFNKVRRYLNVERELAGSYSEENS